MEVNLQPAVGLWRTTREAGKSPNVPPPRDSCFPFLRRVRRSHPLSTSSSPPQNAPSSFHQSPREALSVESLPPPQQQDGGSGGGGASLTSLTNGSAAAAAAPPPPAAAASSSASSQDERAPLRSADGGAAAAAEGAAPDGSAPGPNSNNNTNNNNQLEYTVGEAIDKIGELKRVERKKEKRVLSLEEASFFQRTLNSFRATRSPPPKIKIYKKFTQALPPSTSSSSSSPGRCGWRTPWR